MLKRRIFANIVVAMLLGGLINVQAQDVHVWASTGFSTAHNKGFSNFADNFNRYAATAIDKPLGGFGIGTGYNAGVSFDLGAENYGVQIGFFASNLGANAKVGYLSGESRIFELRRHLAGFELSYGPKFDHSALYFGFGWQLGNTILDSYYIYADGTESHGRERPFNGIYQGLNSSSFFTAKYERKLSDRFSLFAKLSYSGDIGKKAHLSDHNKRGGWTTDWVGSTMLPIKPDDYIALLDQPWTNPYDGPWVMNKFGSLGLQIGIDFKLVNHPME